MRVIGHFGSIILKTFQFKYSEALHGTSIQKKAKASSSVIQRSVPLHLKICPIKVKDYVDVKYTLPSKH